MISSKYQTKEFKALKINFHNFLCISIYQPFFLLEVSKLVVALGTLLAISSAPIFTGIINKIFKWISSTYFYNWKCFYFLQKNTAQIDFFGIVCALLAGLSYSLFCRKF